MGTGVEEGWTAAPPLPQGAAEALEGDGYIILKGAANTSLTPKLIETLPDNELIPSVLTRIAAHWECLRRERISVSESDLQVADPPIERSPQWKALASKKEVIAVTCYHLVGKGIYWNWQYDQGCRGDFTGKLNTVGATSGDLIICNSWLARRLPRPSGEAELYLINFRLKDIQARGP